MSTESKSVIPRTLGLWTLIALVAGNMIGSGIFLLPSSLAAIGTIGIVAWIMTAIGTLFLALVFIRLSELFPRTGGPYIYCHEAYGEFIGFQVAYNYWIALWVGNAAIAVTFVGYMSAFFPALTASPSLTFFMTVGVVWLITLVNIIGIKQASEVAVVTTLLKLIPLVLIAAFGLFYVKAEHLMQFNVSGKPAFSALTAAATLTLWSFIGFESATVPADNVINPRKNIPRATIIGTLIAAVVYIFTTTCVMGVVPIDELAKSSSPFAAAAMLMFGPWAKWLVAAAGAIACFGTLNGWIMLQGQVPLAAARDGLFPHIFTKLTRSGTPIVGLVFSSILITILLALQYGGTTVELYTRIITLAVLATLIPYIFTSVAEVLLYFQRPELFNGRRFGTMLMLASLAFLYTFWAVFGSGEQIIAYGMLLFLSGVPLYVLLKSRKPLPIDPPIDLSIDSV
jgi:basic amino acid/polyamine antiporter, APA family